MSDTKHTPEEIKSIFKDSFRQTMLEHNWAIDQLSDHDFDCLCSTAEMVTNKLNAALLRENEELKAEGARLRDSLEMIDAECENFKELYEGLQKNYLSKVDILKQWQDACHEKEGIISELNRGIAKSISESAKQSAELSELRERVVAAEKLINIVNTAFSELNENSAVKALQPVFSGNTQRGILVALDEYNSLRGDGSPDMPIDSTTYPAGDE